MTSRKPRRGDQIIVDGEQYRIFFASDDFGADYEDSDHEYIGTVYPDKFSSIDYADEVANNVNHPVHYTSHPSGVECITIVRHYNFNVGGAIKYLWRNGLKDEDAQVEDLEKAIWLIQDEIKRLQETASLPA